MKFAALICFLSLATLPFIAGAAWPHTAVAGWAYDPRCCSGRDCVQMLDPHVTMGPEGYTVTIEAGEHPYVTERMVQVFRYSDADPLNNHPISPGDTREASHSQDEHSHACVTPSGRFICFYAPDTGS